MDISNFLKTDEQLRVIDEGTWVDDIEDAPGVSLKVTGWQSKKSQRLLESKKAALRKKGRGKALTSEQNMKCVQEVLAEVVLQDWEGFTDGGKDLQYNKELATKWLTSRTGEDFANLVLNAAMTVDANSSEFVEAVEKKSQSGSSGG